MTIAMCFRQVKKNSPRQGRTSRGEDNINQINQLKYTIISYPTFIRKT